MQDSIFNTKTKEVFTSQTLIDLAQKELESITIKETIEWQSFKISDLFEVDNTWIYGKNRQYKTKFDEPDNETIPVISGVTINNGVNYYTKDNDIPQNEIFSDSLTISTRGAYSGTVTYHDGKFALANNILVMQLPRKWTKRVKIYFGVLVSKLGYGGFNNYPKKETLKNDCVILPVLPTKSLQDSNSKEAKYCILNFSFMESFIKAIEKECIKDVILWQERERSAYQKVVKCDK